MTEVLVAAAAPAREAKPLVEVEGGPGRLSSGSLRELWLFREVVLAFVARHVKVKYKQAAIGIGWAVIQPVVAALLFSIFLGRLAHISAEGAPYLLFALCGMVVWTCFSNATTTGMESLIADQTLLRKVYFPREVLPLAAVAAALVDLVPAFATLIVAALLYGYTPSVAWLLLPVPIALLVVLAVALALGLSALNLYYRDVRYVLPFLLQLALFASPVVYSLDAVPSAWRTVYATLNPVAAAIDALRRIVLHNELPRAGVTITAFVWTGLVLIGSYALFKRLERGFSDRV